MSDYEVELRRIAPWICCPWCDEKICVGTDNCGEIKNFIEKRLKEMEKE